jgi:RND family efflux transporter MFP subunit
MTTAAPDTSPKRSPWISLAKGLAVALGLVGFIAVLMLWLSGFFMEKVTEMPAGSKMQAAMPDGDFVTVSLTSLPRLESAVGTIRAVHEVGVASKILARVKEIRIKAGQRVAKGEILALLDEADLKARLEQAESAEVAARARLDQAKADLVRGERLKARQAISVEELEKMNTEARMATAEFDRAKQAVSEARITEDYATIKAPIAGIIVDKKVNEGDTLQPGQVLATMYDPGRMQMVASVRESLAQRLSVGQELAARIDTLDMDCHATVSEIVPEAQAESRSFQVKVTGPCPPDIISGMFGRIYIPLDQEQVLAIPPEAIRKVGQLSEVDVLTDQGYIARRVIQPGRLLKQGREVLSGLKPGEKIRVVLAQVEKAREPQ